MRIFEWISGKGFIHSIRTQLILYYTVFSLVVLAVGSYFSYTYIMDILKKYNEKFLLQQFQQSDHNIQSVMDEVDRLSMLFVLDENVQKFLETNYFNEEFEVVETQKNILNRITNFISNYSYINSIYLFTENGGGIGESSINSIIIRNDEGRNEFFSSSIYKRAKASYPKIFWNGGKNQTFFNPNIIDTKSNYLICSARGIKPNFEPNRSATLIFNINERYIASIYAGTTDSKEGYMYIIDETGKVVSSIDGKNIGNSSHVISNISMKKDYGSFNSKKSNSPIQVVYYKLRGTNWYLVGEIPLQFFKGDILTLQRIVIIVFASSILVIFAVSFFWLRRIMEPLNTLAGKMHDMSSGKLGITFSRVPKNELGIVIKRFNEMSLSIVELIKKNEEIQEEKRELEMEALQAQINPHFIYNTLNMIKWMAAMIKAKNIIESVTSLGNILRPVFNATSQMCTVWEEMEYLGNYLKIMNWRFGNGINFYSNIGENVLDYRIPRFILQPIIENSITHGISKQGNHIDISIDSNEKDNTLQIIVSDTGIGITQDKLDEINKNLDQTVRNRINGTGDSIGICNVNRRIRLYFGDNYGIKVESFIGKGTVVFIDLPKIH